MAAPFPDALMKLSSIFFPGVVAIATLGLNASATIAATLESPFTINQTSDPATLQAILFGDTPPIAIDPFRLGTENFGNYGGFEQGQFMGLNRGLVISTGEVKPIAAPNCAVGGGIPDASCNRLRPGADLNFDFSSGGTTNSFANPPRDQTFLDIWFNAEGTGILDFDYVFGSEEFPEYRLGQATGDDIFYMMLADRDGNLLFDQSFSVSVAGIVQASAYNRNPIGNPNTALDGYTSPFNAKLRFNAGVNRLILGIDDGGDDAYDSAAFIQQISVKMDSPPSVPTPSLLFGFTWMGWRRWRDRRKSR
jgi:hypothetical protein